METKKIEGKIKVMVEQIAKVHEEMASVKD